MLTRFYLQRCVQLVSRKHYYRPFSLYSPTFVRSSSTLSRYMASFYDVKHVNTDYPFFPVPFFWNNYCRLLHTRSTYPINNQTINPVLISKLLDVRMGSPKSWSLLTVARFPGNRPNMLGSAFRKRFKRTAHGFKCKSSGHSHGMTTYRRERNKRCGLVKHIRPGVANYRKIKRLMAG